LEIGSKIVFAPTPWSGGFEHDRTWLGDDDRTKWRAAHGLTINAIANRGRFRVSVGFERHVPTMTASMDFHGILPVDLERLADIAAAFPNVRFTPEADLGR
jgi:hypothetical protein